MQSTKEKQEDSERIKLDYTITDPSERIALVNQIIENTPSEKMTNKYLDVLADYIIFTMNKKENDKKIITKNRKNATIDKRETSLEGLAMIFSNDEGNSNSLREDSLYNLIIDNDKNIILTPKISITEEDIEEVPGLRELVDEIHRLESCLQTATGRARYSIKKNIIELRKDQYVLKMSYKKPIACINATKSASKLNLYENISINEDDLTIDANVSLLIPAHVSAILCNYSKIKQECYGKFESDMYYLILSLEELILRALEDYPLYYDLLVYKIDGLQNTDIQRELEMTFGIRYSVEYISSLWRNKIPKLIAEQAQKEWLEWHYTEKEKGHWKKCSRCGQIKLGHTKFFSKNKTSKDGWYSICKDCRNKKVGAVKD